ncbi:hypothetical protein H2198_001820 [Neophaeococcomyces mojaviensis]|uniref:Uncharacterized protein n=1 Tax=Neophaeococcomyces mojaviensis TaxID=3383035 RepID=A0ACC3AG35_9EURO|nr:hypothetical protein H2198_001820 [Knufia sp. JES_112]
MTVATTSIYGLTTLQVAALAFGGISVLYGARGIFAPISFATDFGFPTTASRTDPGRRPDDKRNPFVVATGGRTMALGLSLIVIAIEGPIQAAGTVLACCSVSGFVDTISCYSNGKPGAWVQHGIGTMVLASLGLWLRNRA